MLDIPAREAVRPARRRLAALALLTACWAAVVLLASCSSASSDATSGAVASVEAEGTRFTFDQSGKRLRQCKGVRFAGDPEPVPDPVTTVDDVLIRWTTRGEATPLAIRLRNPETGALTRAWPLGAGEHGASLTAADLAPLWAPRSPGRSYRIEIQFATLRGTQSFEVAAETGILVTRRFSAGRFQVATWLDERTPLVQDFEALCSFRRVGQSWTSDDEELTMHGRSGRGEVTAPAGDGDIDERSASCSLTRPNDRSVRYVVFDD